MALLLSLLIAFRGTAPIDAMVNLDDVTRLRELHDEALEVRTRMYYGAIILLGVAFAIALIGVLSQMQF